MKKRILLLAAAGIAAGLPWKTDWSLIRIRSRKISSRLRICVIADLHSTKFGPHQEKIMKKLRRTGTDLIVIPGDLFDETRSPEGAYELIRQLRSYPVFFVEGNHEKRASGSMRHSWYRFLKENGVHIMRDEAVFLPECGVEIAGMHCMHHHPDCRPQDISSLFRHRGYRILLSHRHHFPDFYAGVNCDLVIAGHAHGGQWRIPLLHRGIYAPQSGLFPSCTEGVHAVGDHLLLVSRGLNRSAHGIPRLFNNPEVCMIDLLPAGQDTHL